MLTKSGALGCCLGHSEMLTNTLQACSTRQRYDNTHTTHTLSREQHPHHTHTIEGATPTPHTHYRGRDTHTTLTPPHSHYRGRPEMLYVLQTLVSPWNGTCRVWRAQHSWSPSHQAPPQAYIGTPYLSHDNHMIHTIQYYQRTTKSTFLFQNQTLAISQHKLWPLKHSYENRPDLDKAPTYSPRFFQKMDYLGTK